uniref:Uncharacterized protein n=1 Tax=Corvus moneduloides TaxID=1196302 RepID=A0A8U7M7E7_CORMO
MWLSGPQKKMYLEVKRIFEQQNRKVFVPGDLEHFFNWLFKNFFSISQDLLFDINPPGITGINHGCFWHEIWDEIRDQTKHALVIEALHASLVISEALEEHLYGPITPKAEDGRNPMAETVQQPSQECVTAAVPAEVPVLEVAGPLGSARLIADPIPVSGSPATRPRVRERCCRCHGCREPRAAERRPPRAARNRGPAWKPTLSTRLGEPCRARSGRFHSDTRSRAAQRRAVVEPLTKQCGVGRAEPLAGRGACGDGNAGPRRAQTRAGAAPVGGRGAAATRGPGSDIGVGEAAATRDQQPRRTCKHVIGEVVATKITGTVEWYNVKNNYAFITRDDTGEDLFIHRTDIKRNNPKNYLQSVGDGEVVQFDMVQGRKGLQAANVTGPGGIPVKGSVMHKIINNIHPSNFPTHNLHSPFTLYPI